MHVHKYILRCLAIKTLFLFPRSSLVDIPWDRGDRVCVPTPRQWSSEGRRSVWEHKGRASTLWTGSCHPRQIWQTLKKYIYIIHLIFIDYMIFIHFPFLVFEGRGYSQRSHLCPQCPSSCAGKTHLSHDRSFLIALNLALSWYLLLIVSTVALIHNIESSKLLESADEMGSCCSCIL